MHREIRTAALSIRTNVHTAEAAFDRTLADNARLVATMLDAKLAVGASTTTGDEAVDDIFKAMAHARNGRKKLLEAHRKLAAIGRECAVGDEAESPAPWGQDKIAVIGKRAANAA